MQVLVVPDKFKGTLTASQAADAIARGWQQARPGDHLTLLPMSDGGEGFGPTLGGLMRASTLRLPTLDAAHRRRHAQWWWEPSRQIALVECAETVGLAHLPPSRFHPFELDSTGLGRMLIAIATRKPRKTLIGLGGSATNDAGFGLARSIGWRFLTDAETEITRWIDLQHCRKIRPPASRLTLGRVTIAVDVTAPLLGPRGCSRVFGPQKGLSTPDIRRAESALVQLSRTVARKGAPGLDQVPGAGAAGGLGFGLMSFLQAKPVLGFDLFARYADLTSRIRSADLVLTAEGCLDRQSLMGKGTGEVLKLCRRLNVPCVGLAGHIDLSKAARARFALTAALSQFARPESTIRQPEQWLMHAAQHAATQLASTP